jgi:hypothetical protein
VLLLNDCLLLFISLSTQSGNFWIHSRTRGAGWCSGNATDLSSGRTDSNLGRDTDYTQIFRVFFSLRERIPGENFETRHHLFLPNSRLFTIYDQPPPRVKQPGREAEHSPLFGAEVKNAWSYTSTPPYVFMIKRRVYFTVTFPYDQLTISFDAI